MISALAAGFSAGKKEVGLVHTIESFVNSVSGLRKYCTGPAGLRLELVTKSIFVHGKKSNVEFDYYGTQTEPIELGDLIFVCSLVFERKKYAEKMTITQFKMQGRSKKRISWTLDNKKQLFLLSRFPEFRGVTGIVPKRNYNLPDLSACLGSYGLLYKPGDFAFVSATELDLLAAGKRTVRQDELAKCFAGSETCSSLCCPIFYDRLFSANAYSFASHFVKLNIGEPVFIKEGNYNPQAGIFLEDLIHALEAKISKKPDRTIAEFIRSFRSFPYADETKPRNIQDNPDFIENDGGIGIIHTTVKLGE